MTIMAGLILALLLAAILFFTYFGSLEESSPFECGFDSEMGTRTPISMRFFVLTLVFLVFDCEVSLLLLFPLAVSAGFKSLLIFMGFLVIIIVGFLYEWYEGSLSWLS